MKNKLCRPIIVFGIIVMLMCVTISPSSYGNAKKTSVELEHELNNFDEHCYLDIATRNYDDNVVVYLGNGDGTFGNRQDYYIGELPRGIKAGDFNNDKNLDIIVLNSEKKDISFLYGYGNGTFQTPQYYYIGFITAYKCVVYDYNRDGNLDFALVNYHYKNVSILLGNGDGTFEFHQDCSVGKGPTNAVVGDFNNDQNIDLAVANSGGMGVSTLFGNGDGTFGNRRDWDVGENPLDIVTGDYNNDNNMDIAVTNQGSGTISFLLGDGTGWFDRLDRDNKGGRFLTTADFNLDGNLDLAFTKTWNHKVGILLGYGNCTFTQKDIAVGQNPTSIISKDFNRDGFPDLAVIHPSEDVISIYFGDGNGLFGNRISYAAGRSPGGLIAECFRNQLPDEPTIDGPTNGNYGIRYTYLFRADDINNHNIYYYIDWGDGSIKDWIGPYNSGEEVSFKHIWWRNGTYIIRAKARDTVGYESGWSSYTVKMPRDRSIKKQILNFLQCHPNLFPLLQKLLQQFGL